MNYYISDIMNIDYINETSTYTQPYTENKHIFLCMYNANKHTSKHTYMKYTIKYQRTWKKYSYYLYS